MSFEVCYGAALEKETAMRQATVERKTTETHPVPLILMALEPLM
jgi:hypothetical protein